MIIKTAETKNTKLIMTLVEGEIPHITISGSAFQYDKSHDKFIVSQIKPRNIELNIAGAIDHANYIFDEWKSINDYHECMINLPTIENIL